MTRFHFFCVAAIVVLAFSACSRNYQRDTAPVNGRVTVDGIPLTSGYVIVIPESGRMAKGAIQSDGSFVLGTYAANDGVPLGRHSVVVQPVPADAVDSSKIEPGPAIPKQYEVARSSGLEIEVTPDGIDNLNLELRSK